MREKKERLGILKPKMKDGLNMIGANAWKKVRFCLDSGAGQIVMAEEDLPEVETKESWGSKHGQSYEVANGEEIDNEGEKRFVAHMVTVEGADRHTDRQTDRHTDTQTHRHTDIQTYRQTYRQTDKQK